MLTPTYCGTARMPMDRLSRERGIRYELTAEACDHLVAMAGDDPGLGARPLRHLLARHVESAIAKAILTGYVRAGGRVRVTVRGGEFVIERAAA